MWVTLRRLWGIFNSVMMHFHEDAVKKKKEESLLSGEESLNMH